MPAEEQIPDTYVTDPVLAEEMAHAGKIYEEGLIRAQDTAKRAVDSIAAGERMDEAVEISGNPRLVHMVAEKEMNRYREEADQAYDEVARGEAPKRPRHV